MRNITNAKKAAVLATVLSGWLCGTGSALAANLMVGVPSDYGSSQIGAITGSRVTADVDAIPEAGIVEDLNRDPALFNVMVNGESKLFLRQYTYSTTNLRSNYLLDSDSVDVNEAQYGTIYNAPNGHGAAVSGKYLYVADYDLGYVGVAEITDTALVEYQSKGIDLKNEIITHCGAIFSDESARVHGEGVIAKDGFLYVMVNVNPQGHYYVYEDSYLIQYKVNSDGSLTYKAHTRAGKNTDVVRMNMYNNMILTTSIGGMQNYGDVKSDMDDSIIKGEGNTIGNVDSCITVGIIDGGLLKKENKKVIVPEKVRDRYLDFRDLQILPNGTAYVMTYNLSGSGGGSTMRVYKTTVTNLLSQNPIDWEEIIDKTTTGNEDDKNGSGWFNKIFAEYYTKRVWAEIGDSLVVYTDGDSEPKYTWLTKDFSTNEQLYKWNSLVCVNSDEVTGDKALLISHTPEGLTASSVTTVSEANSNAQYKTSDFDSAITGSVSDAEYSNVTKDNSIYTFDADKVIDLYYEDLGDEKNNILAAVYANNGNDITINTGGNELQLQVENYISTPVGVFAGNGKNVTINADKLNILTYGHYAGNSLTNAIWLDPTKEGTGSITLNTDVNIAMTGGYGGNGIAVQKTDRWGEASYSADKEAAIVINGDVSIKGANTETWGINLNPENVFSRFNNAGILTSVEKSSVTVNGNVDFDVYGNGIATNAQDSTVTVNGGGKITVPTGMNYGYYSLASYLGTINMNIGADGKTPGNNAVQLNGDVFALKTGTINLALTTGDSYLNGIVDNGGTVNMWLQNGATWTNEQNNTRYHQDNEDVGNGESSRVTKLTGGNSSTNAGVIYQAANSKDLTIDSYSGYTKVLYNHGDTVTDILGGDIKINNAAIGSNITLATDYASSMSSEEVQIDVLNALADKLYYIAYKNGENNLSGSVAVLEGLTGSSVSKYVGNIAYSSGTGQGMLDGSVKPAPDEPQNPEISEDNTTIDKSGEKWESNTNGNNITVEIKENSTWTGDSKGDNLTANISGSEWIGNNSGADAKVNVTEGTWNGSNTGSGATVKLDAGAKWEGQNTGSDVEVSVSDGSKWSGSNTGENAVVKVGANSEWSGENEGSKAQISIEDGAKWSKDNKGEGADIKLAGGEWIGSNTGENVTVNMSGNSNWKGDSKGKGAKISLGGSASISTFALRSSGPVWEGDSTGEDAEIEIATSATWSGDNVGDNANVTISGGLWSGNNTSEADNLKLVINSGEWSGSNYGTNTSVSGTGIWSGANAGTVTVDGVTWTGANESGNTATLNSGTWEGDNAGTATIENGEWTGTNTGIVTMSGGTWTKDNEGKVTYNGGTWSGTNSGEAILKADWGGTNTGEGKVEVYDGRTWSGANTATDGKVSGSGIWDGNNQGTVTVDGVTWIGANESGNTATLNSGTWEGDNAGTATINGGSWTGTNSNKATVNAGGNWSGSNSGTVDFNGGSWSGSNSGTANINADGWNGENIDSGTVVVEKGKTWSGNNTGTDGKVSGSGTWNGENSGKASVTIETWGGANSGTVTVNGTTWTASNRGTATIETGNWKGTNTGAATIKGGTWEGSNDKTATIDGGTWNGNNSGTVDFNGGSWSGSNSGTANINADGWNGENIDSGTVVVEKGKTWSGNNTGTDGKVSGSGTWNGENTGKATVTIGTWGGANSGTVTVNGTEWIKDNSGTATIESGKWTGDNTGVAIIEDGTWTGSNSKTATINGGSWSGANSAGAVAALTNGNWSGDNAGTASVTGGTWSGSNSGTATIENGEWTGTNTGIVTMNGGTWTKDNAGEVTYEGGTWSGSNSGTANIYADGWNGENIDSGTVVVEDSTWSGNNTAIDGKVSGNGTWNGDNTGKATVSIGTWNGANSGTVTVKGTTWTEGNNGTATIENGKWTGTNIGTVTLTGGTWEGFNSKTATINGGNWSGNNAGAVEFNGGTWSGDNTGTGSVTIKADGWTGDNTETGVVTVNGAKWSGNNTGSGTVTVNAGTWEGANSGANAKLTFTEAANWKGNNTGANVNVTLKDASVWTGYNSADGFALIMSANSVWKNTGTSKVAQFNATNAFVDMTNAEAGDVTIDSYSGNATVLYDHSVEDEAGTQVTIKGGNFTVDTAAKGSEITLVMNKSGLDLTEEDSITAALTALANKLFYTNYQNDNLTGTVRIAEGLTASSVSRQVADIIFSGEYGQGGIDKNTINPGPTYPEVQDKENFTSAITGEAYDSDAQKEYRKYGVIQKDNAATYNFILDGSQITTQGSAINTVNDVVINLNSKDLTITTTDGPSIAANNNITINNIGTLNVNNGIKVAEGKTLTATLNNAEAKINADILNGAGTANLNLAGGTWTGANAGNVNVSGGIWNGTNSGTITVNGTIWNGSNSGNATIETGNWEGTNAGTVTINGGTWTGANTGIAIIEDGVWDGSNSKTATINGGSWSGANSSGAEATLTNGNWSGDNAGTAIINGGSWTGTNSNKVTVNSGGEWNGNNSGTVDFNGGTWSGSNSGTAKVNADGWNGENTGAGTVVVEEGNTWSGNNTGDAGNVSGSGIWGGSNSGTATVTIGTWSGTNNGTVTFENGNWTGVNEATGTASVTGGTWTNNNNGTATLTNGNWSGDNAGTASVTGGTWSGSNSGTATIENGEWIGTNTGIVTMNGGTWTKDNAGEVTFKGGTWSGSNSGTANIYADGWNGENINSGTVVVEDSTWSGNNTAIDGKVSGSGTWNGDNTGKATVSVGTWNGANSGTVTLESGNWTAVNEATGTATVKGGTWTNTNNGTVTLTNGTWSGTNSGTATIENGSWEGANTGNVIMTGGTWTKDNSGVVEFNGGEWSGNNTGAGAVTINANGWTGNNTGNGSVTVNSATWVGNNSGADADLAFKNSVWTGYSNVDGLDLNLHESVWNNTGSSNVNKITSTAGVIDMTGANAGDITIENYTGSTTVIYKHLVNNDAKTDVSIIGGNITIGAAEKGASITLLTDKDGLDLYEEDSIYAALSALANKVYYTGYAEGNLSGIVKIAEGLTASSQDIYKGDIVFGGADGQGTFDKTTLNPGIQYPTTQAKEAFATAITGEEYNSDAQKEYRKYGVIQESDATVYNFAKDKTSIATQGSAVDAQEAITININGKELNLISDGVATIKADNDVTINGIGSLTVNNGIQVAEGKTLTATLSNIESVVSADVLSGKGNVRLNLSGGTWNGDNSGNASVSSGTWNGDNTGVATIDNATWNGNSNGKDANVALNKTIWNGANNAEGFTLTLTDSTWNNTGVSKVNKLISSASFIDMSKAGDITVANYSGNATLLYGYSSGSIVGGNFTIGSAADSSEITLRTENTGLKVGSEYYQDVNTVNAVLDDLANKLYYTAYAEGQRNLSGKVEISEGLVASSASKKVDITFDEVTGQGKYEHNEAFPGEQTTATINTTMDGSADSELVYKRAGILDAAGTLYKFTSDPTTIEAGNAINASSKNINIEAQGVLNLKATDIVVNASGNDVTIKVGQASTFSGATGIKAEAAGVTVNGDVNITAAKGIVATNALVTMNDTVNITSTDAAITATGANTVVKIVDGTISGKITASGGAAVSINEGKAKDKVAILGDIELIDGSNIVANLDGETSEFKGDISGAGIASLEITDKASWVGNSTVSGLNLTLNSANWTGYNTGSDLDLTLTDSTWNNTGASKVNKLISSASFIDMSKAGDTTVTNYSGNATLLYGYSSGSIVGGNFTIGSAAANSEITLRTENTELEVSSEYYQDVNTVNAVLDDLANKLYYTAYTEGQRNLSGKVEISEGLVASSASKKVDITFDEVTGQGGYVYEKAYPDTQIKDTIESGIGSEGAEEAYKEAGILKGDGSYQFTANPAEIKADVAVDASAKDMTLSSAGVLKLTAEDTAIKATDGKQVNITFGAMSNITGVTGIEADGGIVTITGDATIEADYGIIALDGGKVTMNNTVNITASDDVAVYANGTGTSVNMADGTINGDVSVTGGAELVINEANETKAVVINGDIQVDDTANVTINLNGKDSAFKGNIVDNDVSLFATRATAGSINLNLKDTSWTGYNQKANFNVNLTDSDWHNTGNSRAASINSSGGVIYMDGANAGMTVDQFSGDMTVVYDRDANGDIIGEDFTVVDALRDSNDNRASITLRTASNGMDVTDANETAVTEVLEDLANRLKYEEWDQKDAEGETDLKASLRIEEGLNKSWASADIKFDSKVGSMDANSLKFDVKRGTYETAIMRGAKSAMASTVLMWRSENSDVLQRMGDVRFGGEEQGIWAKYYGGESTFDRENAEYQTEYKAYQLGYDKKLADNWIVGAAVSYNDADHTYEMGGKGEGQAVGLSVYGGWHGDKGHYADVMVKGTKLDNEYTVYSDYRTIELNGDYSTWAMSVSAEYGRRIEMKNGVYIDPSAKFTLGRVQGKTYSTDAGAVGKMQLEQDGFTSAVGEIGLGIGKTFDNGLVYTKFALAHEFSGDFLTTYKAEETKHTAIDFGEIGDTWYEWQIGGNMKISDTSYLYATYEQTFGGDTTEDWCIDAGLRWTF